MWVYIDGAIWSTEGGIREERRNKDENFKIPKFGSGFWRLEPEKIWNQGLAMVLVAAVIFAAVGAISFRGFLARWWGRSVLRRARGFGEAATDGIFVGTIDPVPWERNRRSNDD